MSAVLGGFHKQADAGGLKHFCHIAARYGKLAAKFLSAVAVTTAVGRSSLPESLPRSPS